LLADTRYTFKTLDSWSELLQAWQTHLEALGRDFSQGKVAVDPREPAVCTFCHLHALCRIQERAPYHDLAEEDGDG